ncbi:MAG: sulfite exporter TauE/SafE family protein [Arenicella sp.]
MFSLNLISDVSWHLLVFFACVFFAGIVRGCIGFGFSVLVVASNVLFLDPILLIPIVVILELVASIHMLLNVWNDALWKKLSWVTAGMLIGIPLGVYILSIASQEVLRLCISVIIFMMTLLVLRGVKYRGELTHSMYASAGVVSGFASGVAAAGGIVVATFLSFSSLPMTKIRATLVVYLLITSAIFLPSLAIAGKLDERVFYTVALAIVPMFFGILVGNVLYRYLEEQKLKMMFLWSLSVLSVIGMIRAFLSFMG